MTVTAFVFAGRAGPSELEAWVGGARLAAAQATVAQVACLPAVTRIVVATNDPALADARRDWPVVWDLDPPGRPFHFGERLAALTEAYPARVYAYFGAGGAPLLAEAALAEAIAEVAGASELWAVANNALSSDWLVFNCAEAVRARPQRLGRDNMLAPVLRREAGVTVRGRAPSAATRADVDTPADLAALSQHPQLPAALADYLGRHPPPAALSERWRRARQVLHTPEGRVTLIGRVAAGVWADVERRTRCWVRVLSEERGMTASGRLATGRVRSLVAAHLLQIGPAAFFAELAEISEAVFFDTRVALAHAGVWPSAADRYASDAGRPDLIQSDWLRAFTAAAGQAPIPVLLGGHGTVTGDLYALLES